MNKKFPTPHPSLTLFIETIEVKAHPQVKQLDDINHDCVTVGEDCV